MESEEERRTKSIPVLLLGDTEVKISGEAVDDRPTFQRSDT